MIYLLSIEEQIKNSLALVKAFDFGEPQNYEQLRRSYVSFLKSRHPDVSDLFQIDNIGMRYITDEKLTKPFLNKATKHDNSLIDDLDQSHVIDIGAVPVDEKQLESMKDGLLSLEKIYPEFFNAINLVIPSTVFLASNKAGGGSFSGLLGLIWSGIHKGWSIHDYQEFWIHESTHQFLFLDEIVYEHYDYETFAIKKNWARSAILNINRPLDKVFHSIGVAIEVLAFRLYILKKNSDFRTKPHPNNEILFNQVDDSISSLNEALERCPHMMKPRGYFLFQVFKDKLLVLKNDWININESKEIA